MGVKIETNVIIGRTITIDELMEEYGVEPQGMIEIKALMGDSSDNIPGVAGIGKKTAGELIQKYKSIDYIYENLDSLDIKKGVHDKLLEGRDSAFLSRTLGTICLEAPIDINPESYCIKPCDTKNAIRLLVSLEMFGIIEKLGLTAEKIVFSDEKSEKSEKSINTQKKQKKFNSKMILKIVKI